MYEMYGIPNCDKVKKARKLLEKNGVEYNFNDFKKVPPQKKDIKLWKTFLGELPVNKRGTTFRKIKDEFEGATEAKQIDFLVENSSSIKRPILTKKDKVVAVGFDEAEWANI